MDLIFCHVIFSRKIRLLEEEFNEECHEKKKRGYHTVHLADRVVGPIFSPSGSFSGFFTSTESS
jgi:hypothetical protein